eukprot:11227692-Lingulodinium_polyedra.AAC.1
MSEAGSGPARSSHERKVQWLVTLCNEQPEHTRQLRKMQAVGRSFTVKGQVFSVEVVQAAMEEMESGSRAPRDPPSSSAGPSRAAVIACPQAGAPSHEAEAQRLEASGNLPADTGLLSNAGDSAGMQLVPHEAGHDPSSCYFEVSFE